MSEKDKERDFQEAFNDAYDQWFPQMAEAHKDLKYYLDSPWTAADREYMRLQNREILNFNIIFRIISMISGYERRNRLSLKIGPTEGGDDTIASQLNGLVHPLMQNEGGYETVSDAFEYGACVAGANLVEPYRDRKGDIQFKRRFYNKFMLDPGFTRRDLKDCGYIIIHEEGMRTDEVKSLLPGKENLIEQYAKLEGDNELLPFSGAYRGRGKMEGKRCNYSEFWKRTTKKVKYFAKRDGGMQFEWDGKNTDYQDLLKQFPMQLVSYDDYKETVSYESYVNGRHVYSGPDPNGIDDFPHVLIAGFWCPEYDDYAVKLQGNVRRIRDPQREVSKRISKILDIIDSQVATGRIAIEGDLVDPDDINASGQGKGVWLKRKGPGANLPMAQRFGELRMSDVPAGLFQLNHDLQSLINDIGCVNDSMFGTEELKQQMSGYLMKLRQGAGLVALQGLFDNLRFSKKQLGFKLVKMALANYSPVKVKRIINQEPAGILGMSVKERKLLINEVAKYDCTPQEGINTETQRQAFYVELLKLKELGFEIPDEMILEAFPTQFPQKMKEGLLRAAKQRSQAEAVIQREKQLIDQMRGAKIAADIGRAEERHAQVEDHHADAALARVKMAQEIEGMGFDRIMQLLSLAKDFEVATQKNRQEAKTRR
jgi:hypothetical protein